MSVPRKPDLDQLIAALTADGRHDELAGRDAARTAFRAASQRAAAGRPAGRRRGARFRWPVPALPGRLAAAAGAIAVAGLTAAAYTQVLPGPVQQAAHTAFAPLGVPGGQRPGQPGHSPTVTSATPGGKSRQASGTASRTPAPRPADYLLTVTAASARVPAGTVAVFGGRLTDRGRAVAGARVRLFERLAGSATWQLVATGVTGPRGGFRLTGPPLTKTAVFRVLGPGDTHSAPLRVAVVGGNGPASPGNDGRL